MTTNHPIIRGEFTMIENRLGLRPVSFAKPEANPIAKAHQDLVEQLSFVACPKIHVSPHPEEFEDVADYILRTAAFFDRWLKTVGEEVQANALGKIEMDCFERVFTDALEGNATFVCDKVASDYRIEHDEYANESDYRRDIRAELGREE